MNKILVVLLFISSTCLFASDKIKDGVYQIRVYEKLSNGNTSLKCGTAFAISNEYLISAGHVFNGEERVKAYSDTDYKDELEGICVDIDLIADLSLIKITKGKPKNVLTLAKNDVETSESVYFIGGTSSEYPRKSKVGKNLGLWYTGKIDRNFMINLKVKPGNSGSPVLLESDTVVGVVIARNSTYDDDFGICVMVKFVKALLVKNKVKFTESKGEQK